MSFYSRDAEPSEIVEPDEGLALPFPVLHPALRGACSKALGWAREDIDALLDDPDAELWVDADEPTRLRREGGPVGGLYGIRAITSALESVDAALLLRRLPTPPGADRLAPWLRVVATVRQYERYREMDAPEGILIPAAYMLQEALDALVGMEAPPEGSSWVIDATPPAELRLADPQQWAERQESLQSILEHGSGLLWIDDDRLCVTDGGRTRILSTADGRVLAELELERGLVPIGCDGEQVVFLDPRHPPGYEPDGYLGVAARVLDASTFALLDSFPAGLPLVLLAHGEPEDATLVDLRTGWTLTLEPQDRTYHQAFSRRLDVVWIGDFLQEIFDVRGGRRLWLGRDHDLLDDSRPPVWLDERGATVEDADPEDFYPEDTGGPMAIHHDGDMLIHAWTTVGPIGAPVFGFGFRPRALGFSPDGSRIAALTEAGISIFETAVPRLVRQL